jgi:hypothetical protein
MTEERLKKPFYGFDSIDPRMNRVPLDMSKKEMRIKYLRQHREWFLKNHDNSLDVFKAVIEKTYGIESVIELFGRSDKSKKPVSSYTLAFMDDHEMVG